MTATTDQIVREEGMFGCTVDAVRDMVANSLGGPLMLSMSMLSDAQEEIAAGMKEDARQTINRAKWIIRNHLQATAVPDVAPV